MSLVKFVTKLLCKSLKQPWSLYHVYKSSIMAFQYPKIRRDKTVKDKFHGVEIADPYRWLEEPNSEETKKFIDDQNNVTLPYIESVPYRYELKETLTSLWDFPKIYAPYRHGTRYFQFQNTGLQNQNVLYYQKSLKQLKEDPQIFIDPNTLSEDGTVSISGIKFSEDGNVMAYGLSSSGSDWLRIHFRDVRNNTNFLDVLERVKFTAMTWMIDNKGFFYCAYLDQEGIAEGSDTTANMNQKLYYHKLGTSQKEDVLVVAFEDPFLRISGHVSFCGNYLVVSSKKGVQGNTVYYYKLRMPIKSQFDLIPVITKFDSVYSYITNTDSKFIFISNKDASNFKLVEIDINHLDNGWKDLVSEHPTDVLEDCIPINNDKMVLVYLRDVKHIIQLHDIKTGKKIKDFSLEIGSITNISGKRRHNELFFNFTSFLHANKVYKIDFTKIDPQLELFHENKFEKIDTSVFRTKQVFFKSKDGVKVPMFLIHRNDMKKNGENPCILYGYGGFNISITPSFSIWRLVFVKNFNGIFAVANIRGGGEYGENWHKNGMLLKKQNGFDDFQYAAKFLTKEKYTNPKKLVIQGGSNGGLLVAACMNQAPELFGGCICHVGVLDMLRYHKFTIGYAWTKEYGDIDEPDNFKYIYKYSPLHNIRVYDDKQYPATLILTADHDDRVVPLHSFKFISELQNKLGSVGHQTNPLMIRIETRAGHGAGKPVTKIINEIVDYLCFVGKALNFKYEDN